MNSIYCRDLLQFNPGELYDILTGVFNVLLDDDYVIEVNYKDMVYSRYFWELFTIYTNTPIMKEHLISTHYKDGYLTTNSNNNCFTAIIKSIIEYEYNDKINSVEMFKIAKHILRITNNIYNDMIGVTSYAVSSIDILDFLEISENEDVIRGLKLVSDNPTKETIDKSYSITTKVFKDIINGDNSLSKQFNVGVVNPGQVLQCVGPRGYIPDLTGEIYSRPVIGGYINGLRSLYDYLVESRSGARSLYFSNSALQNSEYFARRLQLNTMVVQKLYHVDCGSDDYMIWRVEDTLYGENGKVVYKGDLPNLVGKYYLDESTNKLKMITKHDTHLVNTLIKLRHVQGCKHPDKYGTCVYCFGGLGINIPDGAVLGHYSPTVMTRDVTQNILGAKHVEFNTLVAEVLLDMITAKYLSLTKDKHGYLLRPELIKSNPKIIIDKNEAIGLTDIFLVNSLNQISPTRATRITTATLVIDMGDIQMPIPLNLIKHQTPAFLSMQMLQYIKEHKFTTDDKGDFIIDLQHWDPKATIARLPISEYNYSAHGNAISKLIETRTSDSNHKNDDSVFSLLIDLFKLVNVKLNIPLSLIEVIVYAITARDADGGDFDLGRLSTNTKIVKANQIIGRRSISAMFALRNVKRTILSSDSFDSTNRPNSPMDIYLAPRETLLDKNRHYTTRRQ